MDVNDPANPYGRVKTVEIDCKIQYTGDDAWNQNVLIIKLQNFLKQQGYDLREYKPVKYWDANRQEIQEDEFKHYIYARHGHDMIGKCPSCPDPVKWKEAERLARRIRAEQGGLVKNKRNRIKTVYILETKEERAIRKKVEKGDIKIEEMHLVKGGGNIVEEY